MALPTVPAAVLDAVAPEEMGKASGINVMAQRFGAVFAIAIGSAVFSARGRLGTPAAFTAGFQPALWACVAFAALATLSCFALTAGVPEREAGRGRVRVPAGLAEHAPDVHDHPRRG